MINFRGILRGYKKHFTNGTIQHILFNWSEAEQCIRHPHGPVGVILRDQGQLDLYSGTTRSILTINGEHIDMCQNRAFISETFSVSTQGIENFSINGTTINKEIFLGQQTLALRKDSTISNLSIIGPETKVMVDGKIGEIIFPVPMLSVFEPQTIFDPVTALTPSAVEVCVAISKAIRGR